MDVFSTIIQSIIIGILTGSIYGLIAIGLSLIFGVMNIINIAHGELVMLGSYVSLFMWILFGINPIISLIASMIILFFFGQLIHRVLIEKIIGEHELIPLMLTFGLSYLIFNISEFAFTRDARSINYLGDPVDILGLIISLNYLVALGLVIILTIILYCFLKFTLIGKGIRAVSQNSESALACGINVVMIRTITFGIAAMLAGAAGTIISMMWTIYPSMGWTYVLKAFAIVILGGLGNVAAALGAALIFGIVEHLSAQFITVQFSQIVPFVTIILVLLLKPEGLFESGER